MRHGGRIDARRTGSVEQGAAPWTFTTFATLLMAAVATRRARSAWA
jgi:hypothetical protein